MSARTTLRGLSDIRRYFFRNQRPIYYVCDMNYYLMGMDEWVRNLRFVNYSDCFDGAHPRVFVPSERVAYDSFNGLEHLNAYLLGHAETQAFVRSRGPGGWAVFLLYDERVEERCRELGLEIILPSLDLRRQVDGKVSATRIADRAGVPSVPNVLARVDSYRTLREVAGHLGPELVVQTPFGDSGVTTFFLSSEADWAPCGAEIAAESEVKIMRRIRCRESAQEACVTRAGTIVGPLMTEIVGFPELTPYRGGWAGNEVSATAFPESELRAAREKTFRVGEELRRMGYRGYFEIDYLTDETTGELYLGEINPRITGASGMTNLAAFAHADAPLFLFHLLEYSDVDFELDVEELNARWSNPDNIDDWSQLIIKQTDPQPARLTGAPPSGVWRLTADGADYVRMQTHRRVVEREEEGFFLRHAAVGDRVYSGTDLGILVAPGRLMTPDHELTERAQRWIAAIRARFTSVPAPEAAAGS